MTTLHDTKRSDTPECSHTRTRPSLATMPLRITDRIVDYANTPHLDSSTVTYMQAHRNLVAQAHTCRALRQPAQARVQRWLVIERWDMATEPKAQATEHKIQTTEPDIIETEPETHANERWLSNIDAIAASNAFNHVRKVVIATSSRLANPQEITDALRHLRVDQHTWPHVTSLRISNHIAPADAGVTGDEGYAELAVELRSCFPAVSHVWADEGPHGRSMLGAYVATALGQLTRISMRYASIPGFSVKTLPSHITHLSLRACGRRSYLQIPQIVAPPLVALTLSVVPLSYAWDQFTNGDSTIGPGLEFTCLERLELTFFVPSRSVPGGRADDAWEYSDEHPEQPPRRKTVAVRDRASMYTVLRARGARFPQLRHVTLHQYPGRVADFLRSVPVEQLETVHVTANVTAFKGLRLGKLRALHTCELMGSGEAHRAEQPHGQRLVMRALAQGAHVRSLSVRVPDTLRVHLPSLHTVRCTELRRLHLSACITIPDVSSLLSQLPYLEQLDLQRPILTRPPRGIRGADALAQHLLAQGMTPISSSLITFVPDFMCRGATDDSVFYSMLVLVARIPSLRVLKMVAFYIAQFSRELGSLLSIRALFPYIRHLATLDYHKIH
ncbi:hypothetical protein IW147_003657 [Coemansia sp. RSA 720]|nr:hypothetical protein IW147_003657 [Coemansia sp. RSA 720]